MPLSSACKTEDRTLPRCYKELYKTDSAHTYPPFSDIRVHFLQARTQVLEKIMPVIYKLLIFLHIRGVNPLADLHLASVLPGTLMNLQEIAEGPVLIQSSQWKEAAETGPAGMDTAPASLFRKEHASSRPVIRMLGRIMPSTTFNSRGPARSCSCVIPRFTVRRNISSGSSMMDDPIPRQQAKQPSQPPLSALTISLVPYNFPSDISSRLTSRSYPPILLFQQFP